MDSGNNKVPFAVMRKMKAARLKWTIPIIHHTNPDQTPANSILDLFDQAYNYV